MLFKYVRQLKDKLHLITCDCACEIRTRSCRWKSLLFKLADSNSATHIQATSQPLQDTKALISLVGG